MPHAVKTPVSHLMRADGVQNSPNNLTYNLDLRPLRLAYDLDLCDLDFDPHYLDFETPFLKLG